MNVTEEFLIAMVTTYGQMMLAQNASLTAPQIAALQALIAAGQGVAMAFAKP